MFFVLICLKIAEVQAETCSIRMRAIGLIRINLCCFRLNIYGLFIEFHAEGQTDMTKQIVAFCNFTNAPKYMLK
jgi:hypothetical protein